MNMQMYKNTVEKIRAGEELKRRTVKAAAGCHANRKQQRRVMGRFSAYAAAIAAVLSLCVTAAAASGSLDIFLKAVTRSGYSENIQGERLPAGEDIASVSRLYNCPEAEITCTGDMTCRLLGLYSDSSAAVISMEFTVPDGLEYGRNTAVAYPLLLSPDGSSRRTVQGGISDPCVIAPSGENSYTLTWCITDPDISGSVLELDIFGIFTEQETAAARDSVIAMQQAQRSKLANIDEYKAYWNENDLDGSSLEEEKAALSSSDGSEYAVNIKVPLPVSETEIIRTEKYGVTFTLDALSLYVSEIPSELRRDGAAQPAVILKDGTVIASEDYMLDSIGADRDKYRPFAYRRGLGAGKGSIYCFDVPVSREDIDRVILSVKYYDEQWEEHLENYGIFG